jgi:hypothetical protein
MPRESGHLCGHEAARRQAIHKRVAWVVHPRRARDEHTARCPGFHRANECGHRQDEPAADAHHRILCPGAIAVDMVGQQPRGGDSPQSARVRFCDTAGRTRRYSRRRRMISFWVLLLAMLAKADFPLFMHKKLTLDNMAIR